MNRRFPPPWTVEEANAACFIVKYNNGQALAYVYFEQEHGRRTAANLLTRDEARLIAARFPGRSFDGTQLGMNQCCDYASSGGRDFTRERSTALATAHCSLAKIATLALACVAIPKAE